MVAYLRQCLALKDEVGPTRSERTAASHHELVRARLGVIYDPERARDWDSGATDSRYQPIHRP